MAFCVVPSKFVPLLTWKGEFVSLKALPVKLAIVIPDNVKLGDPEL